MSKLYIYALKDPETNQIRYVGKTYNIRQRLSKHLSSRELKAENHKTHWLRQLLQKGLKPIIEIIEEVNDENWQEREIYWITYYRKLFPNLTNTHDGGLGMNKGFKRLPETIAKMVKSREGFAHSEETKAKMSAQRKGKSYSEHAIKARQKSMQKVWDEMSPEERKIQIQKMKGGYSESSLNNRLVGFRKSPPRSKTGFKGVRKGKYNRYESQLSYNYKIYYLGTYDTPEEAALVRDLKAIEFWGKDVYLNFPEHPQVASKLKRL